MNFHFKTTGPLIILLVGALFFTKIAAAAPEISKDPTSAMELVFVKGGCFKMGDESADSNADATPVHDVCVEDFYLGKFEVTQGEWLKVMGSNPGNFGDCGLNCPIEGVNFAEIQEFIIKLNSISNRSYRLPTEAEWEYAARSGGKAEKWPGTNEAGRLKDFSWFEANSGKAIHPVGQKKPNSNGLYDMAGNVKEKCQDLYDENYYQISPKDNPAGSTDGSRGVQRGGSWGADVSYSRTTQRDRATLTGSSSDVGFRLLLPGKQL